MLTGKQVSRELPTKDTGIYNPLYPNGQFQKISIPNHGRLPCFNPPLPSEIPKCVTAPMPSEFHNREPSLPFRISVFFLGSTFST